MKKLFCDCCSREIPTADPGRKFHTERILAEVEELVGVGITDLCVQCLRKVHATFKALLKAGK